MFGRTSAVARSATQSWLFPSVSPAPAHPEVHGSWPCLRILGSIWLPGLSPNLPVGSFGNTANVPEAVS